MSRSPFRMIAAAEQITQFVAGLGTSGTMMGTGRYLRNQKPQIELIAGKPTNP